jgi:hypothetical protein
MQSTQRIWFAGILVLGLVWIGLAAALFGLERLQSERKYKEIHT